MVLNCIWYYMHPAKGFDEVLQLMDHGSIVSFP